MYKHIQTYPHKYRHTLKEHPAPLDVAYRAYAVPLFQHAMKKLYDSPTPVSSFQDSPALKSKGLAEEWIEISHLQLPV